MIAFGVGSYHGYGCRTLDQNKTKQSMIVPWVLLLARDGGAAETVVSYCTHRQEEKERKKLFGETSLSGG